MANYSGFGYDDSFYADVDFSTCGIYRFVVAASTERYVKLAVTAGASVLGVLQNNPKAGEVAAVRLLGSTKLYIDASGSATVWGGYVKCASDGMGAGYATLTACNQAVGIAFDAITTGASILGEVFLPGVAVRG